MTEKNDTEFQTEPDDGRTEPERAADRKIEALELELANLQPGVQVILERLRPSWCKGHLEKITVSDEGLDLDYIIRNWGGHLISVKIVQQGGRIRGSHSLELYTFEPRRFGKLLKEPHRPGEDDEAGYQPPAPTPAPSNDMNVMREVFGLMNAARQSEVDTLRAIVTAQLQSQAQAPAPAPSTSAPNPLAELVKAANYYKQLDGLFGSKDTPQLTGEEQFPAQIMEMAKMFFDKGGEQPRARLVDPQAQQRPVSPPPQISPRTSAPAPAPVIPIKEPSGGQKPDIAGMLSGLSANEAAETLIMALGKMDPNKQDDTIEAFMDKFRETMPEFFEDDDDAAEGEGSNSGGK
jgi:hypothetical protein